jgi:AcrR family transcriptional regulator
LVEAMTQVAARHGYADATVARVVEHAGVSRATFYEHFADKEACFLAAFRQGAARLEASLRRIDAERLPERRAGELLDDLLVDIAADPAMARLLLVEALAGGVAVRKAREEVATALETTLESWLVDPTNGFRIGITGRAMMEGTASVLAMRAFRGETARVVDLRGDLLAWIDSYLMPAESSRLGLAEWRRCGFPGGGVPPPRRRLPASTGSGS